MTTNSSDHKPARLDVWPWRDDGRPGEDDERLRARLAEAVAWCDSLASTADLRSGKLRLRLFHDGPHDLVRDLGQCRQHQLCCSNLQVVYESPVVVAGRFMLYFPDENLADGCAQRASGGFFDEDNLPACDTWVSFFSEDAHPRRSARRHLLCYVPAPLIEAANAGIDVNPEDCIIWLDRSDVAVRRRVEALTNPVSVRTSTS